MKSRDSMDLELIAMMEKYIGIKHSHRTEGNYFVEQAKSMLEQVKLQEFRITIVGEFSSGKSTFLNALLGMDILLHSSNETTATITYIRNIPQGHPMQNKARVHFHASKSTNTSSTMELDLAANPNALRDYTTTTSLEHQVVDEIAYVDIYVHIQGVDSSVVFVDTPGLNGVAAGHRQATMREIQKAHASICLFHLRSLSQSNLEFLKVLGKYQRSFLFVLNFIDELKESEGEHYEQKVSSLSSELNKHLFNGKAEVKQRNRVFGVSALKALVYKDHSIKKLYSGDLLELTDSDRNRLWEESRFAVLEKTLWQEVLQGEKQQIFLESIVNSFHSLLLEELADVEGVQVLLTKKSNEQEIRQVEWRLEKWKELYEPNWKRVVNFICSKELDLKRAFKKQVQEDLNNLKSEMEQEVLGDPFDVLQQALQENKYGRSLQDKLGALKNRYNDLLSELLEDVYQSALLRVKSYTPSITIEIDGKLRIEDIQPRFTDISIEDSIKELEDREKDTENKIDALLVEKMQDEREIDKKLKEQQKKEQEINQIPIKMDQSVKNLGQMPAVEQRRVTRTREVPRKKFSLWRIVGGGDTYTEEYTAMVDDTTKQDEWRRRQNQVQREYNQAAFKLQEESNSIKRRIKQLSTQVVNKATEIDDKNKRLARIEKEIECKKEELERNIAYAKSEYVKIEKNRILTALNDLIEDNLIDEMVEAISDNIQNNMHEIEKQVQQYYSDVQLGQKRKLEALLPAEIPEDKSQQQKIVQAIKTFKEIAQELQRYAKEQGVTL